MATRITGMNSGLDTEALVSAMVMNYQAKVTKSQQSQAKLQYKMDALKTVNSDVYSLFNAADKMRWSSAYSLKTTSVSDSTKAKVSAGDTAVTGTQTLEVKELAQAGYLTGGTLKGANGSKLTADTKLKDIETTDGKAFSKDGSISVTVGGKETKIDISGDMTATNLVNKLKDAGLNASFDEKNGRFFISSKASGKDNDFSLVANDEGGLSALKSLGLYAVDSNTKNEYQKWADYTDDELDAIIEEQYAAKEVKYDKKAESYLKTYNDAQEAIDKVTENKAKLLEEYADQGLDSTEKVKEKVEGMQRGLNTDPTFDAYRTEIMDKDEDGNEVPSGNYTYDLSKMEADLKSGALSQENYDAFNKITSEISKMDTVASKLVGYDKTITEKTEAQNNVKDYLGVDGEGNYIADPANQKLMDEVDAANTATKDSIRDAIYARRDTATAELAAIAADPSNTGSAGAVRITGQDAEIVLNGATFTSSANSFSINGLSIETTSKTAPGQPITITTATDSQGIYDKIKDFLSQYNDVINKINKMYNAESAKGYDPLTEEQKSAMSETEISKWESKLKDSALRRDGTVGGIINSLTASMASVLNIGGKNYSLSTFGIKTLGVFGAQKNEQYAYHIDGDSDDSNTSGNSDKLMAAIIEDPDSVVKFFQNLSSKVYDTLNAKMKSSTLSSAYTIYNDKEMASEYSDYTSTIKKWQDKVGTMEEAYYKKFAAMEKTLAQLNSQQSSMGSYFG